MMTIEIFEKIEGLEMVPAEKLVRVADRAEEESERVVFNVQAAQDRPCEIGGPTLLIKIGP
ncbi:hypothetical protein MTR_3g075280 [Medicago truncatula]|uniref:Uncharacterized protein n=1 Tax=Medicago truncatula TaxID=3880 RepID=G8A2G7_MEDTR|nr:hypothetical protein MTR_3g075280 [Medicago truncatula]